MIGIGIDASTSIIGYSVFQDDKLLYCDKLEPIDGNWRERVQDFIPQIQNIIDKYKVDKIIMEDVPLMSRQSKILVQLGVCQGALLTIAQLNNIEIEFVGVGTWRKNIGISTGERDRNSMKIKSIEKANELFGLNLPIEYTRNGSYKPCGSDDIADSILIYASTLNKYKIKTKSFGRTK